MEMVVTAGAVRHAKLQSNGHQQQTNTQLIIGQMPFLLPNRQCQSTEGKPAMCSVVLNLAATYSQSVLSPTAHLGAILCPNYISRRRRWHHSGIIVTAATWSKNDHTCLHLALTEVLC